jgi:ubiquinol-cytochrome c reductase cytochrome b subunit
MDKLRVERGQEESSEPESFPSSSIPAGGAVGERLAWEALEYRIPPVANRLPYMLGGLTFFGIVLLVVTGVLLDQYYDPTPVGAHDSIVYLMTRVPLGNWVRALHYWTATVVLVTVVLHLLYVFWRRSYLRPREVTWWAGVALFLTLFGLAFTGTVLRGDQEGTEALAHAVAGAQLVGPIGSPLTPDFTRSTSLLARLHNAHVSLLPLVLFGLVVLHFWLIRYLGIHAHEPATVPFTRHLRSLTGYTLILVALLGTLAALVPPGIGYPGIEGVEVTKPFWPFLWIYTVENIMGLWGMILAPVVLFGFLFAVPFLDRSRKPGRRRPHWLTGLAILMLALYLGGIVYGVFAPQMQHIGM